ncbi:MAG: 50S ribosomal protein L11 [Chlamydiae bacterium RIFCSPHIGHO2_12_FULL_27_8]|nr:MAG: 50S ribosomal protein L11 [Chlamydiae bacterium RIFCSPHIGHO2_12_FULL_27_8]OGN65386.1 MAG: 50S ribosomal protein L11 [Chlamydiae bacterium RIFCSPLOWO2_01_FULL_28_7]
MAKKKIVKVIKLQIAAGKANPAPPIGPALGAAGVNIMAFCKDFNARTQNQSGDVLPVIIEVYQDKSFSFITLQPPMSRLILQELKIEKGSKMPNRDKVGKLNNDQIERIAKRKEPDLRIASFAAAKKLVIGTAKSMGIESEE